MKLAQHWLAVAQALCFRDVRRDEVGFHAIAEVGASESERQDQARVGHEQQPEDNALPTPRIADESGERRLGAQGMALPHGQRPTG
jgi:hypothetical protein